MKLESSQSDSDRPRNNSGKGCHQMDTLLGKMKITQKKRRNCFTPQFLVSRLQTILKGLRKKRPCPNCFSICHYPIDLILISRTADAFCAVLEISLGVSKLNTGGETIQPLFCVIFIFRPSAQLYYQKIDENEKSVSVSSYRLQFFMG